MNADRQSTQGRCAGLAWNTMGVSALVLAAMARVAAADDISPFTSEAATRGLAYSVMTYPPQSGFYGFGCGFVDFDSDGDLDVITLGDPTGRVGLFENLGGGVFENRTFTSGIAPLTALSSFACADYDLDGDVDIFLTRFQQPSRLIRNEGGFQFTVLTTGTGLGVNRRTKGACWGDYDNDGDPDLFVCNYYYFGGGSNASRNQLFRNNGDGTFTETGLALGLGSEGASLQAVWTDADRDGDLDLYVSNDRGTYKGFPPNEFYLNNGDGTFTETGASNGADARLFSMGLACGDLDGNGRVDFYCTNTIDEVPPLLGEFPLLMQGSDGMFVQAQSLWGAATPTTDWGWGASFFDWNNDGNLDLYVHDQFSPNKLLQNDGQPPLVDVTAASGAGGSSLASYCSAFGDIDGDGDLDLVMNNLGEPLTLLVNREGAKRAFISLRVVGVHSLAEAIGASAELSVAGRTLYRENHAGGNSYLGQNEMRLHFGLGAAAAGEQVTVRWPSLGPMRTLAPVPAGNWSVYPPSRLGDADHDGIAAHGDRLAMAAALGAVEQGTEVFDFDGDFAISGTDFLAFRKRFVSEGGRWADLSGDGTVDAADLAILLGAWGGGAGLADLDADGVIGGGDLSLLLSDWG
jgi:hypothetical protein